MKNIVLFSLLSLFILACSEHTELTTYKSQLDNLQRQYKTFHAHAPRFYLFGMGNREKFIYKDCRLINLDKDSIVFKANDVISDSIMPDSYMVEIKTKQGVIQIKEDNSSIWIIHNNYRKNLSEKKCTINLPNFNGYKYSKVLRVLHHEILINIRDSRIYPNIFVYQEPFYRDAFMASLCLEKTNNTHLIIPWINQINCVYDMQNREPEVDNIGELLYMLSYIPKDSNLSMRQEVRKQIEQQTIKMGTNIFVKGHTDGSDNAEYQTQILKLALKKNGMKDHFTTTPPEEAGPYFDLCWFTQGSSHKRDLSQLYRDIRFNYEDSPFPYLQWARAHYYDNHQAPFNNQPYPLSWEKRGGSAHFEGMRIISEKASDDRICYPHVWTAAEMFLKLYEER